MRGQTAMAWKGEILASKAIVALRICSQRFIALRASRLSGIAGSHRWPLPIFQRKQPEHLQPKAFKEPASVWIKKNSEPFHPQKIIPKCPDVFRDQSCACFRSVLGVCFKRHNQGPVCQGPLHVRVTGEAGRFGRSLYVFLDEMFLSSHLLGELWVDLQQLTATPPTHSDKDCAAKPPAGSWQPDPSTSLAAKPPLKAKHHETSSDFLKKKRTLISIMLVIDEVKNLCGRVWLTSVLVGHLRRLRKYRELPCLLYLVCGQLSRLEHVHVHP